MIMPLSRMKTAHEMPSPLQLKKIDCGPSCRNTGPAQTVDVLKLVASRLSSSGSTHPKRNPERATKFVLAVIYEQPLVPPQLPHL
jgi:hypothetical protein